MNIAIIPARGGSKRIPRKNIKLFCGKPMIAWTIEAAKAAKLFDHIFVSTDDAEIAAVAKDWGAEIPFIRPLELADDYIGTGPVVKHAVEWVLSNIGNVQNVCAIYATAPFLRAEDLLAGYSVLKAGGSEIVFSVTSYPFPIQRAIKITKDNRVEMFQPENYQTRSQDLEPAYHDAGQFYWLTRSSALSATPGFSTNTSPIILPRSQVQDIDTEEDWSHAELMFKAWHDF
jgi:N-acylneuraminate cytidylyltransferase